MAEYPNERHTALVNFLTSAQRNAIFPKADLRRVDLPAAADADISSHEADHYRCDHTGAASHVLTALIFPSDQGNNPTRKGEEISITVRSAGAGGISIKNQGSAANIVSGLDFAATIEFDGTLWRCRSWSGDANPGADG